MAVVIETTLGDITVDLYLDQRPVTCLNFLKLCKMKYYNFNLFHTIRNGFIAQTGDPTGEGSGGQSIWGILEGPEKRFFSGEKMPKIRHTDAGLLSMVCTDDMMVGSQFFLTLAPDLDSLDGTHCVIGEVTEGREVLTKINEVICDENHRPYRDVRITHTVVLEDPFNDPVGLRAPSRSPSPNPERLKGGRIAPDEEIDEMQGRTVEEIQEMIEEKEAKARATILEIVGDLPDAEIAPPENVLFVCKLNPVTTDEDLEIIFSRFGTIVSCEVIKDKKTGNSLQYAFVEFENKKSCEKAYFKMDNVLIDDRRIHVDFSQSVSKMRWLGKGRGVQYFDNDSLQVEEKQDNKKRHRNDSRKNNNERNNKQEHDGDLEQRHNRDREQKHDKDREHRRNRDREHKYDRDREYKYDRDREHRYVRDREANHIREHRHNRDKEQKHSREEEQNRDREQRQYRDKEKRYERDRGNGKERSRSRSRLSESQKNRPESEIKKSSTRKNGDTFEHRYNSRSDKVKHSPIRNNRHDLTKSRSNEESKRKESRSDQKYEKNHKHRHNKHKDDYMKYSNYAEKHDLNKPTESQKETERSRQQNEEPLTPSPTLKRKNDKHSNKKIETKSSKVKKTCNRKKKSRPSTSTSESSSSTSSSDSNSSSESDGKKKKLRKKRRKYSTSSSSTESSSSSSSCSSSSSSSSDSEHKKKKHKKIQKKNSKNKEKL